MKQDYVMRLWGIYSLELVDLLLPQGALNLEDHRMSMIQHLVIAISKSVSID